MVGCEGLSTVLGLTQVLSDSSLAPAERLALLDSLLGLRVAQPSTCTRHQSLQALSHASACDDSQWAAHGHDQHQLAAAVPASAGQLQQSAAEQVVDQLLQPLQHPGTALLGSGPTRTMIWDSNSTHQLLHQADHDGSSACAQQPHHQGPALHADQQHQQQYTQDLYTQLSRQHDADSRQPFNIEQLAHRQQYTLFQQQQAAAAPLMAATNATAPPVSSDTQAAQHRAACNAPDSAPYTVVGTGRALHASEQHKACQQQHRNPSTDDEEWLPPDEAILRYNIPVNHRTDRALARTSPGFPAQQHQDQVQQEPYDQEQELADGNCMKQSKAGRRARTRKNRVVEMLQSVRSLTQQLEQLGEKNATLRQHEQQLEGQLVDRERQVTSMLASKHASESAALQPSQTPRSESSQQADAAAYRLSEPCLGYHPSVFKQDYLPTLNGGIVSPGVLPMFAPLPESAVRAGAQNLTRFVQDARELRALHTGTESEQAVEEYLRTRVSTLQGVMRRYNVMNPVFAYQLRAINLSTLQPESPPVGHWATLAQLMRSLITHQEYTNLKLAHRLFQASLRAVKKEQAWVLSQITTTSQRLQHMTALHGPEQLLSDSSSNSHTNSSALEISSSTATSSLSSPSTSSAPSSIASSAFDTPLPTEAALLDRMQLQQQLDDLLQQLEVLLLREHDQHFTLLWSCVKMPSSIKVVMELVLSSYPYFVNYHEILPHLLQEDFVS